MSTLILYIKSCSVRVFVKLYFLRLKFWRHNQDLQMTCHSIRVMQSCCSSKLFLTKWNVLRKKNIFFHLLSSNYMNENIFVNYEGQVQNMRIVFFHFFINYLFTFEIWACRFKSKVEAASISLRFASFGSPLHSVFLCFSLLKI